MDGCYLLPTRGRIKNLRRFLSSAREMGFSTAGWILVDDDDYEAHKSEYDLALSIAPTGWEFKVRQNSERCYGQALRNVWDDVKGFKWVGLVSDDLVPCTANWDSQLVKALRGWDVVSSNDGWQSQTGDIGRDRLHGAICFHGDLLRAVGFLFPEGPRHIFHDDVWETLGRETGCWQVRVDIMCKHLHEALEGVRGPTMDPTSDLWKHDEAWFVNWKATEKNNCVARIKTLMAAKGVRTLTPDFTGVKLMIGTPCMDARYDSLYMSSLFQTMAMFQSFGVRCTMAEEKFTADISLARAKIFGAFLRSDATHLLTIDSDMAWDVSAITRLFYAKKDFVAVAGPKKRYPLTFAANYTDSNGNPIQLMYDQETGTMEVGEIGSAFCLITRNLAEKMAGAYPELEFIGITGEREFAMYNPMVVHYPSGGRYYSEDFAFCRRWQAIGGKVFFIPDVPLSHTGSHTFHGAFSEVAMKLTEQKAA